MATANHPKNQQPHGLGDQVQISTDHAKADQKPGFFDPATNCAGCPADGCFPCPENYGRSDQETPAHQKAMDNDTYPQWVVVEFPGTDREQIVMTAPTMRAAMAHLERNYTDDDCPADVMRQLPDGTLTTEF